MAMATVPAVEINGVGGGKVAHESGNILLGRFDQQMEMVAHEAKEVEPHAKIRNPQLEAFEKASIIGFVTEQQFTPIVPTAEPAGCDVVNGSWKLNSQRTRHERIIPTKPIIVNFTFEG
jgi:hypothetical protein